MLATYKPLFEDLMHLEDKSFFTPVCFQKLPVAGSVLQLSNDGSVPGVTASKIST